MIERSLELNKKIWFLILVLTVSSCQYGGLQGNLENDIKEKCVEGDTVHSLSLDSLTNFDWQILYIVEGPRFPDEVGEVMGVPYKNVVKEHSRQYIFILDDKIVKEFTNWENDFALSPLATNDQFFVKFTVIDRIRIRRRVIENVPHFEVVP